jgi:hypothetical protein
MANIKPIQDKQCERIQCRLTIAEKNILQKKADAVGKALGRYIIDLGLADAVNVLPTELSHFDLQCRLGLSSRILEELHAEVMLKGDGDMDTEQMYLQKNYRLAEELASRDPDNLRWYAVRSFTSITAPSSYPLQWVTTKPLPVNKVIAKGDKLADYLLDLIRGKQPELTPELIVIDPALAKGKLNTPDPIWVESSELVESI